MFKLILRSIVAGIFIGGFFIFPQMANAGDNDVDVLISYSKPYNRIINKIEAVGGTVRFQYKAIDGVAATLPRDQIEQIQNMSGVRAFKRDITFSIGDPPAVTREGFGEVSANFNIDAADLSGDMAVFTVAAPDGYYPTEVGLTRAPDFWAATGHLGEGVIVGIMDSGTADVAAISGRVLGGESFLPVNPALDDGLGPNDPANGAHGTWVATTLGADVLFGFFSTSTLVQSLYMHLPDAVFPNLFGPGIDGVPMVGQAPFAEFFALKIFNVAGATSNSIILAAFDRAIELKQNGIVDLDVINGSFSGPTLFAGEDPFFAGMMSAVQAAGIVTVFSASNEGPSGMTIGDPALARNNIAVGATNVAAYEKVLRDLQSGLGFGALFRANNTHQTAYFSSRGPAPDGRIDPDITAPGFAIFAQGASGGLNVVSGTSFSAPMVAGAAALLLSAHPGATPDQIRAALLNGANPNLLEDNPTANDQGFGFLDVLAANTAFINGAANPADDAVGKNQVELNIKKAAGIKVIHGNNFSAHTGDLLPGERAEYSVEVGKNFEDITITISNVTPELPASQQNQLFGDDLFVNIHSGKTSAFGDYRDGGFIYTGGATFVLNGSDLDEGIARVTLMGDWTNAGKVSASVNITRSNAGNQGHHDKGRVAQGESDFYSVNVPAGASELQLKLQWKDDYAMYPTDDLDLLVVDPNGFLVLLNNDGDSDFDGLSLDSPERLNISNPTPGNYTLIVDGFTVWQGREKYKLFADVVTPLAKLAAKDGQNEIMSLPIAYELSQNFPNPFNPTTSIKYDLPQDSHVTLKIFNINGQLVRTLINEASEAGYHSVRWNGKDNAGQLLPSGTYFYHIIADNFNQTRRMVLLK